MAKQMSDEAIAAYKEKEPTAVQTRYADWLIEKLSLDFKTPKDETLFRESVRLATALRMIFQASPENQGVRAETRAEREEAAANKPAKKSKAAKTETDEDETDSKPAKKSAKAKAAKPAAAPAPDAEDDADEAVAPAAKKSAPKKAARSGKPAPF